MVDVLAHFVDSVPQPLTDALVNLAPVLAVAARATRLIGWSDDWYSSWLTLASWWMVCLAAPVLFRCGLPLFVALAFIQTSQRHPPPFVTENVLQSAIADLTVLRSALPTFPSPSMPPIALLRAAAILTVPWLIVSYLVPARILLAIMGSLVLTHRAPWACVLRSILWRSAFVRTSLYHIQALLTGQPLPKLVVSNQPTPTTPAPVPSLRFLFTVYENQRWWMGLDWTAALLPSERPSWCSPSLHPVSPPNAFTLPNPTTVYLPSPDGKSRIKRTATWKWEEPEWKLIIRKEGSPLSRIERAPPAIDEPSSLTPSSSATSSGSRLLRAATNKLKESSIISSPPSSPTSAPAAMEPNPLQGTDQGESGESFTDPDGWIYGDNKWENQSCRGGLGKVITSSIFTRHLVSLFSSAVHTLPTLDSCCHRKRSRRNRWPRRARCSKPSQPGVDPRPAQVVADIITNSDHLLRTQNTITRTVYSHTPVFFLCDSHTRSGKPASTATSRSPFQIFQIFVFVLILIIPMSLPHTRPIFSIFTCLSRFCCAEQCTLTCTLVVSKWLQGPNKKSCVVG